MVPVSDELSRCSCTDRLFVGNGGLAIAKPEEYDIHIALLLILLYAKINRKLCVTESKIKMDEAAKVH